MTMNDDKTKYRSGCDCKCHNPDVVIMHCFPCCFPDPPVVKPGPTDELTENPQEAAKVWPETLWHGHLVIEGIYKLVSDHIEPLLTAKGWTFQEVYLAYLDPFNSGDEDNGFIVGWDVWANDGGGTAFFGAYVQFDVEEERGEWSMELSIRNPDRLEIEGTDSNGFYNKENGARKHLKENWSGLVELRLD
jgi:hypothetical protein